MSALQAELHIHSCLSPCADDDMTPANIAGMAMLAGADIAALTDHNSTGNCPAFFAACEAYGVVPVAGMELTTAEEIHLVCLFETLEAAMAFGAAVRSHRMRVPNRPECFGNQILMDAEDRIAGEETDLLLLATDLTLEAAAALVRVYGGAVYPAHIDRASGGILAILGSMPDTTHFAAAELRHPARAAEYAARPDTADLLLVPASDAHQLYRIGESMFGLEVDGIDDSRTRARAQRIRSALIDLLRHGECGGGQRVAPPVRPRHGERMQ